MDRLNLDIVENPKASRSGSKKRKWREIEAIKEKFRLEKELQDIERCFDLADEFEY